MTGRPSTPCKLMLHASDLARIAIGYYSPYWYEEKRRSILQSNQSNSNGCDTRSTQGRKWVQAFPGTVGNGPLHRIREESRLVQKVLV